MSTRLSPDKTPFSHPTHVDIMSVNEEQNIMNNGYYTNVCQAFYPDDNLDNTLTSYPSQMHAQSHILPSATAFPFPNNVDMTVTNTMDYRNAASDYALYQETANYPVSYHCPSDIHTMNGQSNMPSHDQVGNYTNDSYPAPVSFQTLLGFSALDVENNYPSDPVINHSSILYIFTQMPMQTSLSSNNSNIINESTNSGYVVMKVECTHLGRISAADMEKILPTPQ
ncbi:2025_t:CDS:1 [Paraglomus brasilianum]|uniref:2025_t:CDS:1 n=1 Tax=Paraglomus brasilianum TaxID=144538 RepID=A0A9N9G029_9GLOM|nr:2025_t:CDS:1 [Paraglomus brasilianum]